VGGQSVPDRVNKRLAYLNAHARFHAMHWNKNSSQYIPDYLNGYPKCPETFSSVIEITKC